MKTDRADARRQRRRAARQLAVRYALIYAVFSILWIVLSDRILGALGLPENVELILASVKGILFVAVTATLLLVLGLRYFRSLETTQERYTRLFENAVEGLTLFRVLRDKEDELVDLEIMDLNPTQQERTGLTREEAVGRRLSHPDGLDERTRSYLEMVASAAGMDGPARSELHVAGDDAYELLEAYPVGRDRWALSALDITGVRHAERALRRQEETIRRTYVDVLDAVTGGKLVLLTDEELAGQLGVPLTEPTEFLAPRDLSRARGVIARVAAERFPDWAPGTDIRTPVGEALVNALRHAGGGLFQLYAHGEVLQVAIRDEGPGIDFRTLPRATLQRGFSTASSLGMGFTIMLQVCERVLLSTHPGRTTVVLEFAARQPVAADVEALGELDARAS
ncbi:MAG TPA: ATP-binding protein [Thermoleophilia bacterium]|nr:ATP-binding protein [Thermoleophilia bacterium]